MGRRILFLGPPGGGKGTQAKLLTKALGIPHISSGELLRDAIASQTELGRKASGYVDSGDLVPDDLVVAMMKDRLCRDDAACGYVLDGFPRNADQAEALANAMDSDGIETTIVLHVDEAETVERLLRRAGLEGRADDNEATIRHRLKVFREETEPLIAYYGDRVRRVDGVGSVEEIFCRAVNELAS